MARPPVPSEIPEIPWAEWWTQFQRDYVMTRENAQHVTILGPNGTGKSTLAMKIAELRPYVFALGTKPRDSHFKSMLRKGGYRKVDVLPEAGAGVRKAYLWPPNLGTRSMPTQRKMFAQAMDDAFGTGVWHGLIDEGHYVAHELRLEDKIRIAYQQGRSNGHGLILCAQRPAWLPPDIYSGASHLFLFGTNDSNDLKRISGMNGVNDRMVRDAVAGLGRDKRFLHVDTGTGKVAISRIERGGV